MENIQNFRADLFSNISGFWSLSLVPCKPKVEHCKWKVERVQTESRALQTESRTKNPRGEFIKKMRGKRALERTERMQQTSRARQTESRALQIGSRSKNPGRRAHIRV